jgi:ankyrin repeat protein
MKRRAVTNVVMVLMLASIRLLAQTDANQQAKVFWDKKFTTCGQSTYTQFSSHEVMELKGFSWRVVAQGLTPAELQNGVQYRGQTVATASTSRLWFASRGWQPWQNGLGGGVILSGGGGYTADMLKQGGRWSITPNSQQALSNADAPVCSEIPKEQVADPNTRAAAACQSFFSAIGTASPDTAPSFLNAGLNLNTCRGPGGRTPLMVASGAGYLETVRMFVERGANATLKDSSGNSALAYARQYAKQYNPGTMGADEAEKIIRILQRAGAQ